MKELAEWMDNLNGRHISADSIPTGSSKVKGCMIPSDCQCDCLCECDP